MASKKKVASDYVFPTGVTVGFIGSGMMAKAMTKGFIKSGRFLE
jgi:hypothetical protein